MTDVKIISHRGANKYAPQNTLPAFKKSIQLLADGVETDVHMTKDGVPVICHNYTINDTSNGMGTIASYTLEDLKKFDFGAYYSSTFRGTEIPTLDEFLELIASSDIEIMNIELKKPRANETDIVKKTIAAVKAHGLFDRLLISSFSSTLLTEAKKLDPRCKTGYLYSPNNFYSPFQLLNPIGFAKKIGADALHPMDIYVGPLYVKMAHAQGIKVNVWTVNSDFAIKRLIKCGVDGIITDCPDKVWQIRKEMNK